MWSGAGRFIGRISTLPTSCSTAAMVTGAPRASFFLWLDMAAFGGGEAAAKTLWKACGVRVLPGTYLARAGADGRNPGENHVRVALVHDDRATREALAQIVATLG